MRRRERRYWSFVKLEKTSFPKTQSPLESKLLKMKNDENEKTIIKKKEQHKMNQITNKSVKTDAVVDAKLEIKQSLAVLDARVREAPLS